MGVAETSPQTVQLPIHPFCCTSESLACKSARKELIVQFLARGSLTCLVVCKRSRSTSCAATTLQNFSKHVWSRSTNRSGWALDAISCMLIPALTKKKYFSLKLHYVRTTYIHILSRLTSQILGLQLFPTSTVVQSPFYYVSPVGKGDSHYQCGLSKVRAKHVEVYQDIMAPYCTLNPSACI